MLNKEFKNYLRSYCSDTGVTMPLWSERIKLCTEFNKVKYSHQLDTEVALWEFLDDNLMKKKDMQLTNISFGCIATTAATPCQPPANYPWDKKACNQEEKEDTMTYNETEANRKYLNNRLYEARYVKRDELVVQFNIHKPSTPRNYKQLIDAITAGQYTLDTKRTAVIDAGVADGDYVYNAFDGIKWTFPGMPDLAGFSTAEKAMEKAYTATKDTVNTGDAVAGLAALQAFEAFVYTAPAA